MPLKLTYGIEGFEELRNFLTQNYKPSYTLSIFNILDQSTAEIFCSHNEIIDVIIQISNIEHTFPEWIGKNDLSESYVVGMVFSKGMITTPSIYEFQKGKLIKKV